MFGKLGIFNLQGLTILKHVGKPSVAVSSVVKRSRWFNVAKMSLVVKCGISGSSCDVGRSFFGSLL